MTQVLQSPGITLQNKAHTVIPQIGFGTFQIPPEDTQRSVEEALEIGYRHIDTAAAYYNEEQVGDALRATGMANKVWVTTKLRNCDQGSDPARIAFEESRRKLGVDVVDMYLIHWPFPAVDLYKSTRRHGRRCSNCKRKALSAWLASATSSPSIFRLLAMIPAKPQR